jgi:hypothetical protein
MPHSTWAAERIGQCVTIDRHAANFSGYRMGYRTAPAVDGFPYWQKASKALFFRGL